MEKFTEKETKELKRQKEGRKRKAIRVFIDNSRHPRKPSPSLKRSI